MDSEARNLSAANLIKDLHAKLDCAFDTVKPQHSHRKAGSAWRESSKNYHINTGIKSRISTMMTRPSAPIT